MNSLAIEALNSGDKEIAELYANILWNEIGRDALMELLKNNPKYEYSHTYKDRIYIQDRPITWNNQSSMFLQDPNKSILIDIT